MKGDRLVGNEETGHQPSLGWSVPHSLLPRVHSFNHTYSSHPPTIDHFPPATTDDCQELLNGWLLGWRSGLVVKG